MKKMISGKAWVWIVVAAVVLVGGFFAYPVVKLALSARRQGFFDKAQTETYEASTRANLLAIYKGLMLFHESEGQFPKSSEWMDAIKNRIQTSNMSEADAAKKLIDPTLGGKAGGYGYAMNDAASQKFNGDLKNKKMPLVFMSSDTSKNAHGDPEKLAPNPSRGGGQWAITVAGDIVKLR